MDYLSVIRNRNFLKLWGSQIFSQIAQNLLYFALIIRVFDLAKGTHFANVSVALLVLAFGIPSIIFGPMAGVYVDYWNRKWVMVIANLARAVLILFFLDGDSSLAAVLALSFAVATFNQFFAPAESASIPRLVSKGQLAAANALFVFTLYGAFIVGYSSSALAVKLLGHQGPYVVTSGLLGLAALLDFMLPSLPASVKRQTLRVRQEVAKVSQEVLGNFRTITRSYQLYFPIIQLTVAYSVVGIILALAPALSLSLLHAPLTDASHYLIIPAGLGLVAGVILVTTLMRKLPSLWLAVGSMLVASICLTAVGLSGLLYRPLQGIGPFSVGTISLIVAVLVFVMALFNAVISTASQTMLQEATTDSNRGKVFGALGMSINIAATVPVFLAGILADVFSVTRVIAALGLALTLFAAWQIGRVRTRTKLLGITQADGELEKSVINS